MLPRSTLDRYAIEYGIVRLRNRMHFALSDKGSRTDRKFFVLGQAKTGTTTIHGMFQENGLRSQHSAGNWTVGKYDAFSDRGDYRPFEAFDGVYPNAAFVLNCRSYESYLRSLASHRQKKLRPGEKLVLSPQYFVNQALRKHRFAERVLQYFRGRGNLTVVNIEMAGSMEFLAEELGLRPPSVAHAHKTKRDPLAENESNLAEALRHLGLEPGKTPPLLLPGAGLDLDALLSGHATLV